MLDLISYFQEMWQLALQGDVQGIWFWAALYAFTLCTYSLIFQLRTRTWPVTQGELIEASVEKFGVTERRTSDQNYMSGALYHYSVSGTAYEGTRISPWIIVASHNARFILEKQMSSIQKYPAGKVKVFYNPKKPKKSFLIIASKVGIFITFLISILPAILYFFKFYS